MFGGLEHYNKAVFKKTPVIFHTCLLIEHFNHQNDREKCIFEYLVCTHGTGTVYKWQLKN